MLFYLTRRLLQFIPVLALASIFVFGMVRLIPGNAAALMLGPTARPEQIAIQRELMGLDLPITQQYIMWISRLAQGDLGKSYLNDFPVTNLIARRLLPTLELTCAALLIALMIAIPLGAIAAFWQGRWPDRVITLYSSIMMGVPDFWLGLLLVLVFALRLNWVKSSGYASITQEPSEALQFIILPAVTLASYISAVFIRFIKSTLVEVLSQDYIRTAYSKGLKAHMVIMRHAFRNALIPLVTVLALQLGGLLGGVVITESIFDWPGLGRLLVTSIQKRDYAPVQAVILLSVVVYLVINLIADLTYSLTDPRIRFQGRRT